MEPILSWLSTFFSWLIDYTVDISILICLIFIIRSFVAKKFPAWWKYSLWIVLLLRMVIPVKFESPLNIPNVVPLSIDAKLFDSVLIEEDIITHELTPELYAAPQGWNVQVDDVLLSVWVACAIIFGIFILIKNIKFRNAIGKEPLLTEKRVIDLLEECKLRMKIHIPLQITITDKVKSPALFGYIKPRLLLPVGVPEKLNDDELSYMFLHELGHLKRHDIGVSWLITFIQIFQWFNPFVWLAFYQMRIDQESACDASVLARIKHDQTIDYASTIVGFLENFCRNHKLPALVGILENQTQIKNRITMIVNYRKNSKIMMFFSTALLLFIGIIFFSIAGFEKVDREQASLEPAVIQAPFEVKKDLLSADNDTSNEMKVVIYTGSNQGVSAVIQEGVVKEKTAQDNAVPESQKEPVSENIDVIHEYKAERPVVNAHSASSVIKEQVAKEDVKQALQPQETVIGIPDTKIEGKIETTGFTEGSQGKLIASQKGADPGVIAPANENLQTRVVQDNIVNNNNETKIINVPAETQKAPVKTEMVKEDSHANPEANKDLLSSYFAALPKNEQISVTTALSEKVNTAEKDKSKQFLDLARSVYFMSKNMNYTGELTNLDKKPNDGKVHSIRDVDEQPKIVSYYPPIYPFKAQAKGIEGRVLLRFIVDKEGSVLEPQVISAEPEGIFEQAALDTVVKYKLKPAMKDGKSVNSIAQLPISFSINDNYLKLAQK